MEKIIEAFVEAGYFRARISTLSDFDKIIGGIAWAMQTFSYDININIFYADTLDLGQKIALTERLVIVLLVMNCPHQIEPHQIVGLDYASLLPVVRWLIKRSAEVRREHEAFNRLLALRHFHRVTNSLPNRSDWCYSVPLAHLKRLAAAGGGQSGDAGVSPAKSTASFRADDGGSPEVSQHQSNVVTAANAAASMASTSLLIDRLRESFKSNEQVSFIKLPSLFRGAAALVQGAGGDRADDGRDQDDDDGDDDQEDAGVAADSRGPTTHKQEQEQVQKLPSSAAIGDGGDDDDDDGTKSASLSKRPEEEGADAAERELDIELLATNQKILNLLRKLDSMPSELEIAQYQRRYIELHQQLISKNKDVKKLYALFNSSDSTKHYLTKEINLLDSIMKNLDLTNNSVANRDQFLAQFQEIISRIQGVRDDVLTRLEIVRGKWKELNEEYACLV